MINEEKKSYRVRKMTKQRLIFTRMADNCIIGGVSRGALIALAHQLPVTGLINATEQSLLIALINTANKKAYEEGGKPIVFKSNAALAFEIGRSEGRISRLLSRLFDCGLVVMRDSPNFKRFSGSNTTCGIDLRILIARYDELKNLVDEARTRFSKLRALKREYAGLRNQLRFAIDTLTTSACLVSRLSRLVKIDIKAASVIYLKRLIKLFRFALYRAFALKKESIMTDECVKNDIHHHNTKPKPICNCNNATEKEQTHPPITTQNAFIALEREDVTDLYKKSLADEQIINLSGKTLSEACPETQFLINSPITSINVLIEHRFLLAKFINCSTNALQDAEKTMGLSQTALALAVTYEKYSAGVVTSGGGYFRALTQRFREGRLNIIRSLFGLRHVYNG